MKAKNFWLLMAAAVVAAAAIVIYNVQRSANWENPKGDRKVLPHLAVNEVARINVIAPDGALTVVRKEDGWHVAQRNDYPADFSKVRDLLRTIWELKAVREMQVGPSQWDRLQISPPGKGGGSGIQVELSDQGGKTLDSIIIGKSLQTGADDGGAAAAGGGGRFVYHPSDKDRVYLVSNPFADLQPLQVNQWLDKNFVAGGDLDRIVRDDAPGNPGWTIVRTDPKGPWTFGTDGKGEKVKEELANLLSRFSATFTDVRPPDAPPAETGLDQPIRVSLHTTDDFNYKLAIGKPGPDKTRFMTVQVDANPLPASRTPEPNEKPEDKKARDDDFNKKRSERQERLERERKFAHWIYEVPDYNLENFLKPKADLESKAAPPAPTPAASALPAPGVPAPEAPAPAASVPAAPLPAPETTPSPTPSPTEAPTPRPAAASP